MRSGSVEAPVVVGLGDGRWGGAVEWASAEAAASGSPLRIVHVVRSALPSDPYGVTAPLDGLAVAREAGEELLREAVARARAVAAEVEVSAQLVPGTPARALPGQCAGARLLVLGAGGPHLLPGPWAGGVARTTARTAARAGCPVVVVRPPCGGPEPSPPRVVLGVDGGASCGRATEFAFRAARQRGVPLVVVHAWQPDPPADLEAVAEPPRVAEERARRLVDRAVNHAHAAFPDVPVHTALVRGEPAAALLARARGAALLVVGTRGRGRLLAPALGPVGRVLVRRCTAPLAVVRADGAASTGRVGSADGYVQRVPRWPGRARW